MPNSASLLCSRRCPLDRAPGQRGPRGYISDGQGLGPRALLPVPSLCGQRRGEGAVQQGHGQVREASPSRWVSVAVIEGGAASCQNQTAERGPGPGGCWLGLSEPSSLRSSHRWSRGQQHPHRPHGDTGRTRCERAGEAPGATPAAGEARTESSYPSNREPSELHVSAAVSVK